jgi:hypothetical protein
MRRTAAKIALAAVLAGGVAPALAQNAPSKDWREVKCERYRAAWTEALSRRGTKGIGREFLDNHEAFLASGCTTQGNVCPRSEEELALANIMVVAAMNAGTASTFPPFACRR